MSTALTLLGYLVALTAVLAIVYAARSVRLQNRFRRLGTTEGRTLDEIVKLVGPPNHHTKLAEGREILEWRRVGFHRALSFSNGVCDGQIDVHAP
jgi:hypothetical protein